MITTHDCPPARAYVVDDISFHSKRLWISKPPQDTTASSATGMNEWTRIDGWRIAEERLNHWASLADQVDEDGNLFPSALSLESLQQVFACLFERQNPPPQRISSTGDGGVSAEFWFQDGLELFRLEVECDGEAEWLHFKNDSLISTDSLSP